MAHRNNHAQDDAMIWQQAFSIEDGRLVLSKRELARLEAQVTKTIERPQDRRLQPADI